VASAAPVLAAYFADSDYGQVVGAAPSGLRWGAWLDARTAYLLAFDSYMHMAGGMPTATARRKARDDIASFGMRPAVAARLAVQWAAEAGYTVSERPIKRLLRTSTGAAEFIRPPWKRYLFPEELFSELLVRLGIPRRP